MTKQERQAYRERLERAAAIIRAERTVRVCAAGIL